MRVGASREQVVADLEVAVVVGEVRGPVERGPAAAVALVDLGAVVEEVVELMRVWRGGERRKRKRTGERRDEKEEEEEKRGRRKKQKGKKREEQALCFFFALHFPTLFFLFL